MIAFPSYDAWHSITLYRTLFCQSQTKLRPFIMAAYAWQLGKLRHSARVFFDRTRAPRSPRAISLEKKPSKLKYFYIEQIPNKCHTTYTGTEHLFQLFYTLSPPLAVHPISNRPMINFIHHQTVVDKRKLYNRRKSIRCTAAQKVTAYYSIYKIDSPHSYTETKNYLVFFKIKQLGSSTPK